MSEGVFERSDENLELPIMFCDALQLSSPEDCMADSSSELITIAD